MKFTLSTAVIVLSLVSGFALAAPAPVSEAESSPAEIFARARCGEDSRICFGLGGGAKCNRYSQQAC
jgi:hypothetical protein